MITPMPLPSPVPARGSALARVGSVLLAIFLLAQAGPVSGQVADTLPVNPPATILSDTTQSLKSIRRGPRNALLWSIVPGGGQVYNRRWWKVPLVYGGLLGIFAYADFNQTQYRRYVTAIESRCLGEGNVVIVPNRECIPTPDEFPRQPTSAIRQARDNANRARQNAFIGIALVYILQGVEAYTDAHLQDFDISDDLSLRLGPVSTPGAPLGFGVTVSLGGGADRAPRGGAFR